MNKPIMPMPLPEAIVTLAIFVFVITFIVAPLTGFLVKIGYNLFMWGFNLVA